MDKMQKKVVFITGGSRGIGKATVDHFTSQGWTVATCSTHVQDLKTSSASLTFECDVANAQQVKSGIARIMSELGRLDAVVNNAGLSGTNPLEADASDEMWHRIVDVNLNGPYYVCKYAAPHLPDHTGRIVTIASVLALKGVPDQTAYCAAKHGVLGFTRSYAHCLSSRGITVNAVCPGWVRTEMAMSRIAEIGLGEENILGAVPLGRFIEPKEVADFVYYLCSSPGAAMITGQALTMDGGA